MVYDLVGKADEDAVSAGCIRCRGGSGSQRCCCATRHRVWRQVVDDFDRNNFNTAIAAIMELVNAIGDYLRKVGPEQRAASADEQALATEVANVLDELLAPSARI